MEKEVAEFQLSNWIRSFWKPPKPPQRNNKNNKNLFVCVRASLCVCVCVIVEEDEGKSYAKQNWKQQTEKQQTVAAVSF